MDARKELEAELLRFQAAAPAMPWEDRELLYKRCPELSRLFYRWMRRKHAGVEILEMGGYLRQLPSTAAGRWRRRDPRTLNHKVVSCGDWVADPSAGQFGSTWPRISPLRDYLDNWGKAVFSVFVPNPCQNCEGEDGLDGALASLPDRWPCLSCGGSGQHQLDTRFRMRPGDSWVIWHETPNLADFVSRHAVNNVSFQLRPWPPPGAVILDFKGP